MVGTLRQLRGAGAWCLVPVLAQVEEDICSEEAELVARTQEKLAAAEVRAEQATERRPCQLG